MRRLTLAHALCLVFGMVSSFGFIHGAADFTNPITLQMFSMNKMPIVEEPIFEQRQPHLYSAEELTKDEIITALSRTLSNLIKERDEEMEEDEEEYIDDNGEDQTWPIFARGGDYGPRYDVSNESQKRSEIAVASEVSNSGYDNDNEWYYNPLSKKDLESLIHQPNPALTVQQLPQNPKISFRKGHPSEKKEQVEITTSVPETSLAPHQGMKEVAMLRPNTGAVSPLYALIEAQQLKNLAKGKQNYVNKKTF